VIVRETQDGSVLLITQEDHAELSAQFAAHWGNEQFSKLKPYESMVFATLHHTVVIGSGKASLRLTSPSGDLMGTARIRLHSKKQN
jgi:hypothetical protein